MRRWSGVLVGLLFLAGISVLLYPAVSDRVAARNHSRAIVQYAVTVEQLEEREIARQLAAAADYNASLSGMVAGDAFSQQGEPAVSEQYRAALDVSGMIGYIGIPSIDVHLPVYHTVSEQVLRKGVGHVPESALPIGEEGAHTVLSAHRGLPSAKLFTDLNRLEEGDLFSLYVLDRALCYRVDQIRVVEPHETEALQPATGEDYVTLVTCTPYAINSHRLLVRGSRVAQAAGSATPEQLEEALHRQNRTIIVLLVVGLAAVAVCARLLRKRRGDRRR